MSYMKEEGVVVNKDIVLFLERAASTPLNYEKVKKIKLVQIFLTAHVNCLYFLAVVKSRSKLGRNFERIQKVLQ